MSIRSVTKNWLLSFLMLTCVSAQNFAAERYNIDSEHTFSTFEYNHWGLSFQRGRFDSNTGFIELDMNEKSGEINIEIDSGSISTGIGLFDKVLRSADFFNAADYPKISFKSSRLHFDGERLALVEGYLTIKGTTRPTALEITHFNCRFMAIYGKRACGANGFAKILRSDFNLGRYVPFISDAVTLYVSVEAIKEY